jgi:hypothetical protein
MPGIEVLAVTRGAQERRPELPAGLLTVPPPESAISRTV